MYAFFFGVLGGVLLTIFSIFFFGTAAGDLGAVLLLQADRYFPGDWLLLLLLLAAEALLGDLPKKAPGDVLLLLLVLTAEFLLGDLLLILLLLGLNNSTSPNEALSWP